MIKHDITSDSLRSMTGYDYDLPDLEIELAGQVNHGLEPNVIIIGTASHENQNIARQVHCHNNISALLLTLAYA